MANLKELSGWCVLETENRLVDRRKIFCNSRLMYPALFNIPKGIEYRK
jgi:hypothetical protein